MAAKHCNCRIAPSGLRQHVVIIGGLLGQESGHKQLAGKLAGPLAAAGTRDARARLRFQRVARRKSLLNARKAAGARSAMLLLYRYLQHTVWRGVDLAGLLVTDPLLSTGLAPPPPARKCNSMR